MSPAARQPIPPSVLMNAVPAKVAGVEEVVMVTPPTENLNHAVLAAAKIAGVDRVIGVGGVQAVAALIYGAGFIPRVDKLVGPAAPMWRRRSGWPMAPWTLTWWRGPLKF